MKTTLVLTLLSSSLAFGLPQLQMDTDTLAPDSVLQISFSKPVVATGAVGKPAKNTLLDIKPKLQGTLRWIGPSVAEFHLSSAPALGKTYTFSMRKGQKFADGSGIEAGKLKSLPAPEFLSERTYKSGSNRLPTFFILFNDAISATTAASRLSFKDDQGRSVNASVKQGRWGNIESLYYVGPTWKQRAEGWEAPKEDSLQDSTEIPTTLFVTPAAALPIGNGWRLHLAAGLPNASGSAATPAETTRWASSVSAVEVDDIEAIAEVDEPRHITVTFNKPLPRSLTDQEIGEFITLNPVPADLKITYSSNKSTVFFHGNFRAQSDWTVQVKNGLAAADGLVLEKSVTKKLSFQHIAPRLAVASDDQAQLASGNNRYEIETVNISSVRLRIKQLKGNPAVRAFQGYRHYTGDGPNNETIKRTNPLPFELLDGKVLVDKVISVDSGLDRSKLIELNWRDYLPEADPFALLFVSLEGTPKPDLETRRNKPVTTQTLVQLTDIGLAWKINKEEAFIYAYSCETGLPLSHVKLDVFGEDSASLHSTRTGVDGVARVPRSAAGRHLRATWGDDTFLTAFDQKISTVSMWRFPVRFAWDYEKTPPRHVFLFTDRSLYRPGETVHLKGIVRNLDGNLLEHDPSRNPRFVVHDSAHRIILDKRITLSKQGSFDQSFSLPDEIVGRFDATISWPEEEEAAAEIEDWQERYVAEKNTTFSHSFRVEEFRRNAFEVESTLALAKKANTLDLQLDANYFQGQAVANGTVNWFLNANSTGFYPANYRDYLFGDHRSYDRYYWSHYFGYDDGDYYGSRNSSQNGATQLDEKGHAALEFTLPEEKFPTPRRVTATSEVTDARNQMLSSSASLTVHSSDIYLGVSRQDQLIRVGTEVELKVVTVQSNGKPAAETIAATLSISRQYNEQVKIVAANGRTSVRNEEHIEELGTQTIKVQASDNKVGGLNVPFMPTKPGRHTFTFSGTDAAGNSFRTASILYVYGADEYPWAFESGMKIKLVPEKPNYLPGETARILVLSPIEGTALITLEREGVQSHFIRELRSDNPVIEIPVTEADAPNVFASVLIIKGARDNRRKVKEPILRLGYCELKVTNVKERLAVSLKIPGDYHRPGEEVTVSGLITNSSGAPVPNSEVTLYAEDEGTLAVMGYRNPNPMAYFYAPRQLRTTAGTSLGNFISESPEDRYFFNKGFFIGGGDGEDFDELTDIDVREDFTPCAHWAPALRTDAKGRFSVTFNSPDTLTRYRVIAVAHEGTGRFGSGAAEFTVNKPLMLEPSVPRFASEGDTLHPKVLVQNSTEHAGTWEVSLQLDSITAFLEGADRIQTKTITLQPKGSAALSFDVRMINTGTSDWTWSARPRSLSSGKALTPALDRKLSDAVVSRFEVSYPMALLRETHFVRFQEPEQNRNLLKGLNPELLRGRGELELQFGKSLLLEADGALDHLLHYPYGCVEQTTSSTIPWIAAKNLRELSPTLAKHSPSKIQGSIQAGAKRLLSMQTRDGGLSYWPGGRDSEFWASSYGGMALLLCKEAGADVPDEAITSLTAYLTAQLRNLEKDATSWHGENLARACFVLAMTDKAQEPYHNRLLDKADKLSLNARCFLALAIHEAGGKDSLKTAQRILDLPAPAPTKDNHWMRYRSSDAYRLLATNRIRPKAAPAIVDKLLAGRTNQGHWRTTWCNAWSFYALGDYAAKNDQLDEPVTIELITADGPRTIKLGKGHYTESIKLPLHAEIKAIASNSGTAYVRVKLAAKPDLSTPPPASKGGFQIARTYHRVLADGSTEPLKNPKIGDLIKVELAVTVPSDNSRYLVIDDSLPSLFETVNTDFASQAGAIKKQRDGWNVSHKELRDDRAVFFLNHVYRRGTYTVSYHARVTTAGQAVAPPAKIEAMYDPQSYALTAPRTFRTPNPVPTAGR